MRRQLRRLGLAHDPRRSVSTTDPSFYRWTQWIFLQIFNSWYDTEAERARPDRGAGRRLRGGRAGHARRSPVGRAEPGRAAPPGRRPPAGLHLRGAGELVPGPGHRAGQRGGHRRRSLRPRQLPGVQAQPEAVDDADHRLRRPAAGRPGPARLARVHQADAAQLDRPVRGRPHRLPGRRRRHRGRHRRVHDPPDTLFGATYMVLAPEHPLVDELLAPTWPDGTPASWTGGAATPEAAVAAYRRQAGSKSDIERQVESREKTGVFIGAYGAQPRERRAHPGLHRRLRADGLRHRGDHGGARPGRAGLGVRRGLRPADRPHRAAARRLGGRRLPRRRAGDQQRLPRRPGRGRGQAGHHRVAGQGGLRRGHRHLQAAGLAVQPPALLGRAVPDRVRRDRAAHRAARSRCCRSSCPTSTTTRPSRTTPTTSTPSPPRPWATPSTGSTSSSTWATGRSATSARPTPCRSGPARAGTSCATSTRRTRTPSSTRRSSGTGWARSSRATGRRRPVRRRRRARRAAPAVRPVLAQGAVRPGLRLELRAVPAAVQPGLHPGRRLHRRAGPVRRGRRRGGARRRLLRRAAVRATGSGARWARA